MLMPVVWRQTGKHIKTLIFHALRHYMSSNTGCRELLQTWLKKTKLHKGDPPWIQREGNRDLRGSHNIHTDLIGAEDVKHL